MSYLAEIGRWIAENESLLSGMAALVVLTGVIFSPLGTGLRRLLARREPTEPPPAPSEPVTPSSRAAPEGGTAPSPPTTRIAARDEPLLAVLAFDNLSTDPEMQFFSDGVSPDYS